MDAWPRPPHGHPLAALDAANAPVLRSNPLYTEEEPVIIITVQESLAVGAAAVAVPRAPRRVPSTSSGYGSGGSGGDSRGRGTPSPPAPPSPSPPRHKRLELTGAARATFHKTRELRTPRDVPGDALALRAPAADADVTESLREELRSCLRPAARRDEVGLVLSAALEGGVGAAAARARLEAALRALLPPAGPGEGGRGTEPRALPYCGPGVRPGDVTMLPKSTDMSLLAASALFTLDAAKGELLARRLARGRRRRRRCRAVVALAILALLLAAVGAADLVLSRGTRMFGLLLQ